MDKPPMLEALIWRLMTELASGDYYVSRGAKRELVGIGEAAISALSDALRSENESLRWNAVEALGEIKNMGVVGPLINALKDKYWYVRRAAVEGLGGRQEERAVTYLIEALKDDDWRVRRAAVEALEKTCTEYVGCSSNRIEDLLAIRHARSIQRERVAEALSNLLETDKDRHESRLVRRAAAKALGNLGDRSAVDALIGALENDSYAPVRANAAKSLGQLCNEGDEKAVSALIFASRRKQCKSVRVNVKNALKKVRGHQDVCSIRVAAG